MEEERELRRRVTVLSALIPVTLCVNYMLSIVSQGLAAVGVNAPFWWSTFGMNVVYIILYASVITALSLLIFGKRLTDIVPVTKGHIGEKALFVIGGMGAAIIINIVYSLLLNMLSVLFRFEIADWSAELVMPQTNAEWLAYAVMSTVLPAVFEELVFRGAVLGHLKRKNAAVAVVVSAVLFGFYHGTLEQIPVTLCLGLMLGYFCLKFDSILVPMSLHFVNNLIATVETYIVQTCDEMTANLIVLAVNLGVIVAGIVSVCIIAAKYSFSVPKRSEEPAVPTKTAFAAAFTSPALWLVVVFYSAEAVIVNYIYVS